MKILRAVLLFFASFSLALAGCGGGGGVPSSGVAPSKNRAAANFKITIPLPAQSVGRQPKYVSPNTQSVTITSSSALSLPAGSPCTASGNSVTCTTTGASSGCTAGAGTLVCTFSVIAQVGNDQFTLTMFSAPAGGGSQLSTGTVAAVISATGANNVAVTLNGVVASVTITLGTTSPPSGVAADIAVTVIAKDASGATIVGPGNYNTPIALTDSDPSGATTLSPTSVSAPGTPVNLHYSGGALVSATISATATGVSGAAVTPAVLTPGASPSPSPSPTPTPTTAPACAAALISAPGVYTSFVVSGNFAAAGAGMFTLDAAHSIYIRYNYATPTPTPTPTATPTTPPPTPTPTPTITPVPTPTPTPRTYNFYTGNYTVTGGVPSTTTTGCAIILASQDGMPIASSTDNAIGTGAPNVSGLVISSVAANGMVTAVNLTINSGTGNGTITLDDGESGTISITGVTVITFDKFRKLERLLERP